MLLVPVVMMWNRGPKYVSVMMVMMMIWVLVIDERVHLLVVRLIDGVGMMLRNSLLFVVDLFPMMIVHPGTNLNG